MEEVINHYAKKFGIMPIQISEKEHEILKKFSNKFPTQDLLKAIDSLERKPTNADALSRQLMTILSNLNASKRKEEKTEEKVEKKEPITFDIPDNYKEIFTKYNIPINIIDFNTLSTLDKYMKSFYLSDTIAEYLYTNLSQEKLQQYTKMANKHFSKMKLTEREKPKAYKIYIKLLIKKELGIYV